MRACPGTQRGSCPDGADLETFGTKGKSAGRKRCPSCAAAEKLVQQTQWLAAKKETEKQEAQEFLAGNSTNGRLRIQDLDQMIQKAINQST